MFPILVSPQCREGVTGLHSLQPLHAQGGTALPPRPETSSGRRTSPGGQKASASDGSHSWAEVFRAIPCVFVFFPPRFLAKVQISAEPSVWAPKQSPCSPGPMCSMIKKKKPVWFKPLRFGGLFVPAAQPASS